MLRISERLAVPRYAANATQLAVVTAITQTRRMDFRRRQQLYVMFATALRMLGVPLYTFELVQTGTDFVTPDDGTSLRVRVDELPRGWQKEHQLNCLIARLPAQYTKVAWLDADIIYEHDGWAYASELLLDTCGVAQLFSQMNWCGPADNPVSTWSSCLAPRWVGDGLVGFAWGAWRDVLDAAGGLYWRCGSGANDAIMARTHMPAQSGAPLSGENSVSARTWQRTVAAMVPTAAYLAGHNVRHIWHGPLEARNYAEWDADLVAAGYDADRDCRTDGLFVQVTRPDLLAILRKHGCA